MKKFKVFLSPIAEKKLEILLNYIAKEWDVEAKNKYITEFKRTLGQVSSFPKSCPESLSIKGLRKCIVTKQSSFFYRIKNSEIEIITIFDNRQDQNKVFEELKKHFA
ncbi:MAG: type II toxin-antitoxin system RelE/ParE family toxin [Saprospiraceae bacterium]|nr:type II toxin-antitoxin system RelE/ParE family toxin [Saprospiraceae bacterium]